MDCDKLEFLSFYFPPMPPVELLKNNDKDKETDGRWSRRRNKAWMVCALASPGVVLNGLGGGGRDTDQWGGGREAAGRGAGSCRGEGAPLRVSQNTYPKLVQLHLQDNALPAEPSVRFRRCGPRWMEGKLTCLPSLVLLKIFYLLL